MSSFLSVEVANLEQNYRLDKARCNQNAVICCRVLNVESVPDENGQLKHNDHDENACLDFCEDLGQRHLSELALYMDGE